MQNGATFLERIKRLEAKQELASLISRYHQTADRMDWSAWIQTFAPEARFDLPNSFGLMDGRDKIYDVCVAKMDGVWADTQHMIVNRDFELIDGGATGTANIIFTALPEGASESDAYLMGGRYRWKFRNEDGGWRIIDAWEEFIWNTGSTGQDVFEPEGAVQLDVVAATVSLFTQRLASGAFIEAFSMLAEDAPYTVIGTTPASRVYNGRRDVLENLVPVLSTFRVAPSLTFDEPIISGDRAVILGSGSGEGPTGPYDQPHYAFVTRVGDGVFLEIKEFMDTAMLNSAVFGKQD